ncbi:hypothetical protein PverR02_11730 [Pseudomonas veronii]|nr:hypothetical protein PverR02_11730 [Pseudomonas veronii]
MGDTQTHSALNFVGQKHTVLWIEDIANRHIQQRFLKNEMFLRTKIQANRALQIPRDLSLIGSDNFELLSTLREISNGHVHLQSWSP